jgi:hypothetical protein
MVGQAVSPANFQATNRNYETNPKERFGTKRKITKRTQRARSKWVWAAGFACNPPRSQQKLRSEPKARPPPILEV